MYETDLDAGDTAIFYRIAGRAGREIEHWTMGRTKKARELRAAGTRIWELYFENKPVDVTANDALWVMDAIEDVLASEHLKMLDFQKEKLQKYCQQLHRLLQRNNMKYYEGAGWKDTTHLQEERA